MNVEKPASKLPAEALAALRQGRTSDAIRVVREKTGIGLKEAAERVDAALQRDPSLLAAASRPPIFAAIGDYLASSWKFPLAAGLGMGAGALYLAGAVFPGVGKDFDPGIFILVAMGLPLTATAIALVIWQRKWRARRGAETTPASAPAPAERPKFAGLPDPGAPTASQSALSAAALTALDRGDPIAAIKILRGERGIGLAQAKALVDAEILARSRRTP
jgi:ribosomal protein L7/L12